MSSPILPKNIDITKLKYSEVKTLQSGAKSIYINYGAFGKLRVQTPVLNLPYGLGEGFEDKNASVKVEKLDKDKKYDLTVSFKGIDENSKIKTFHDKIKELESKIIEDAFNNRQEWFRDDFDDNKAFVAKLYSPNIKLDKDKNTGKVVGKYPPTFKIKIPYDVKNSKFMFDSYDMENNEIEFETIMKQLKGGSSQLIIELMGIWMAGGKFGCTWKVISGKFKISMNQKIVFLEDSDTEKILNEENDDEEDDEPLVNTTKVENSEEENDDEPTTPKTTIKIEVPPAPKKVGRKKG